MESNQPRKCQARRGERNKFSKVRFFRTLLILYGIMDGCPIRDTLTRTRHLHITCSLTANFDRKRKPGWQHLLRMADTP